MYALKAYVKTHDYSTLIAFIFLHFYRERKSQGRAINWVLGKIIHFTFRQKCP